MMNPEMVRARLDVQADVRSRSGAKTDALTFNPLTTAMRSRNQTLVIVLMEEPDSNGYVRIMHEQKEHRMLLSGVILWECKKWSAMRRPLKDAEVTVRYKHGGPRPEVDVRAGCGGHRTDVLL